MPVRTHEFVPGEQYGCWTVIRELPPERKSWGLERKVQARCNCGREGAVLPKVLLRRGTYCKGCNPGRSREIVYNPGDVYGPWTVVREVEGRQMPSGWARQILARCSCGNEVVVFRQQLLLSRQCQRCTRTIHIEAGQRFGLLVVLDPEIPGRTRKARLRCDCGSEIEVQPVHLANGNVASCGCLKHRRGSEHRNWTGYGRISGAMWKNYRNGARHRGLEFNLTLAEAWKLFESQQGKCALTGIPIDFQPRVDGETTASLDRIDSTLGYHKVNVQWVHKDVNRMKGNFTEDRFRELCRLVAMFGQ